MLRRPRSATSSRKAGGRREDRALQDRVEATKNREDDAPAVEIDAVSGNIRALEQQVGDVSERLEPLERELELRALKLNRLNELFQLQTERLEFLQEQHRIALDRLDRRLVQLYKSDAPDDARFPRSRRAASPT